ncbi:RHS repeat-associated core domain-containing protein [Nocardiopsis sp. RV163]|uniref:RHS repeat-associated core domain-containing protein n=1 Tax=Nocardiopsis sp. RV163 TaxID=1661388 RepID=UPI0009E3D827|nr:RHS repeat-associated core domain-containing protein [Nocardiopsis sp. RV163]
MRRHIPWSLAAATAASTLLLGLLSAPTALADTDPHSPRDRTVAIPDTWQPGEASTEPVGQDPPAEPWTPPGTDDGGAENRRSPDWSCSSGGENLGLASWYPMERHQISDRLDVDINLESGNAVIRHRDMTIRGTGVHMGLNSVYNSRDLNTQWKLSYGRDIGLKFESDRVAFHGPTGSCDEFMENEDGEFDTPAGLNATLTELSNGHYALTYTRGEFADEVWHFDANGWAITHADRNGNTNNFRYTTGGDLAAVNDSQGRTTSLSWDEHRPTQITDPTGETAVAYTYANDSTRHPSGLTDRAGNEIAFGYTGGYLTSITDAEGATWKLSYDAQGRVTSFTEPHGENGATWSYDHEDGQTTVTDPGGGESTLEFDDSGRQTSATDQVDNTRSQTWTANSDIATTTDALEASVTYDYDDANNLIGTELPTGASTSVGYGDAINPAKPTSFTGPDGNELSFTYDEAGNMVRARSEAEDITVAAMNYHHNGTVSSATDARGNRTTYSYDDVGNMTGMSEPGPVGETSYTYDSLSRLTSVTDGNGVRLEYGYDRLDRVVSVSHDGDVLQSIVYDGNGRQVATHTDQVSVEFAYDGRGGLLQSVRTDSSGSETTSYGYDTAGNLTAFTEHGKTTTYTYDAAFRLTSLVDHTGAETTFDHDENNQRTNTTHPDGASEDRAYDDSGRLTSITTTGAAEQTLLEASYSWTTSEGSDSDQLQSRTIDGETETFTYDGLDRLTSNGEIDYAYDDAGNLTSADGEELVYNGADQVTDARGEEVGHDEAGNMTSRGGRVLEYSLTNQFLTADDDADLATSISYDTTNQTQMRGITDVHEGERVDRQLSNTALGVTNVASEGERTSFVRDANGELISMVAWDGQERFHFTTDHQNTVLAITAEGSEAESPDVVYDYTPFGERSVDASGQSGAASLNPFGFTGAYQFQDGTVHLGYRFYDTNTLNFTQPDPSRQEMNNYAYGMGDPINNTDPLGLKSAAIVAGDIGAAALGTAAGVGVCALTGGIGCLLGGAVAGAAAGGMGGLLGASVAGGSQAEVQQAATAGLIGGAITGPMPPAYSFSFGLATGGYLTSDSA